MSASNSKNAHQNGTIERRINQFFALIWVAFGIIVIIQNRDIKYMDEYGPGSGFLPFWLGVTMIILGFALLAQVAFRSKETDSASFSFPSKHAAWQMFLIMFGFFGFVFLCEEVGFLPCMGLQFFFLLIVVERKGWKLSLVVSVISVLSFWVIFEIGLQLRLPMGLLNYLR